MPFPEEREPNHTEQAKTGLRLRAFTERAFGVWQSGIISHVNHKKQTVTIQYNGYKETRPFTFGFYYEYDHPHKGQHFTLTN